MKVKVQINYFKPTGKWHSRGEFDMDLKPLPGLPTMPHTGPVPRRIEQMRADGQRPGLVDSKDCEFVWVVSVVHDEEVVVQYLWLPGYLHEVAVRKWYA